MKKMIMILMVLILALGTAAAEENFLVTAPDGAPAIAVAALAAENPDAVRTIAADTIAAEFANEASDFVIAPINAGAKLFRAGKSTYRLAAVLTWGNLVFASQREGFTPEMINGSKLTLFGENTINASIVLYVLEQKGIVPSETEYLAGAKNTQELLMSDAEAIVVTAEPAVTAAAMKNGAIVSCLLNDLYREVTGNDGFAQAGLFVREKTLQEKPEEVRNWLEKIRASAEKCSADPEAAAEDAVALGALPNKAIAMKAIPNCGIRYVSAKEAREQIEQTAGIDPAQFGGALPADDFYYDAE